jgi:prepilin-type N-terminal cleavage/methylation domain-containing protein
MNQRGFTLIEAMVVVGVLTIMVAVAIPNYLQWSANRGLREDILNLRSDLQIARMAAISNNQPVSLQFNVDPLNDPNTVQYVVFLDNGGVGGGLNDGVWDAGEALIDKVGRQADPADRTSLVIRSLNPGIGFINLPVPSIVFASSGGRISPAGGAVNIAMQSQYGMLRAINVTPIGEVIAVPVGG